MSVPVTRYMPSRHYLSAGFIALVLAAFSAWVGFRWAPAFLQAFLFVASAAVVLFVAFQPAIEVHETFLRINKRLIPWSQIRRLDRTGWISPLVVHLTLADDQRLLIIYPGDLDAANSLLRQLRRFSRDALIDGVPYRQFWGEALSVPPPRRQAMAPKGHLLLPEDEAEVERMFQRLKTVGHIDPKQSQDEK